MFEVELYELLNCNEPVRDFIESLEIKMQTKALAAISLLSEQGNDLREPYSKAVGWAF